MDIHYPVSTTRDTRWRDCSLHGYIGFGYMNYAVIDVYGADRLDRQVRL